MIKSFPVLRSLGVGGSYLVLLLVLSILAIPARATELTDLGEGLSYLRVHALDDSAKGLTAAIHERNFLIVDVRHATGTAASADVLRTALNARELKTPVFILVGPATPIALAESLMAIANKCLTIGVKDSIPTPQVIIDQPAATDRLAYEAVDSGQLLASLISGKISKDRFDEVALMKEFANGNINAAPPPPPNPTAKPASTDKAQATEKSSEPPVASKAEQPAVSHVEPLVVSKVEPLTDRVLQRAIHLHRALLALKNKSS